MPPGYAVRFRRNAQKIRTLYCREWCSAQRIRITMIAGGNHSIISMNGSPTVLFEEFPKQINNHQLNVPVLNCPGGMPQLFIFRISLAASPMFWLSMPYSR